MTTSMAGLEASAASADRSTNEIVPSTSRRSVPNRALSRGKAYINGTSMAAPTAHAIPTSAVSPPSATTWTE